MRSLRPFAFLVIAALLVLGVVAYLATKRARAAGSINDRPQATLALPADRDPLVANMDPSVNPGADFFAYACGGWLKRNPIPATERGWGIGNLVREDVYNQLVGICQNAAASGAA